MKSKSYAIEFTGIGGVGKSTIIEKVCEILDESNITYDNLTKIKNKQKSIKHVFPILKALYLTFLVKPNSLKGFRISFKGLAIHQLIYNSIDLKKQIRVFDEGIIHKIRALRRNSKTPNMIKLINKLSKYNVLPDMLIIIEANPSLILERKIKRNRQGDVFDYDSILKETTDTDFEKTMKLLENGKYEKGKRIKIIRLKNNTKNDILVNANKIVEIIHNEYKHLSN